MSSLFSKWDKVQVKIDTGYISQVVREGSSNHDNSYIEIAESLSGISKIRLESDDIIQYGSHYCCYTPVLHWCCVVIGLIVVQDR